MIYLPVVFVLVLPLFFKKTMYGIKFVFIGLLTTVGLMILFLTLDLINFRNLYQSRKEL